MSETTLPPRATAPASDTTAPAPTVDSAETTVPDQACPEGEAMVSDGRLAGADRPGADGATIGTLGWRSSGECETVTISFATADGAPATTPPSLVARIQRDAGILRVETEATSSLIVDQLVESPLVGAVFVPTTDEGTRFVDLTLTEPVIGRARILTSPARLEIDLQPGGTPDLGSPLVTQDLVIVEPPARAGESPIVDVSGYAFGPEQEITLEVVLGNDVIESTTLVVGGEEGRWAALDTAIQVGNRPYDGLRISGPDGDTIAGIPFTEPAPEATLP